ncbi:hypothetical protein [Cohnella hongkongensis]|uniref:Uncharacterized protein n=1 Tax=Cohnella hongkongensis TaxID=178337 RepID=A0ABV9FD00_9BACL
MEKRLNRSDLMFSLAFLLMLVIAIGAFFYGVKVGTDRAQSGSASEQTVEATSSPQLNAYQQQDLVSFYHTVFLSYREFQNDWLDAQNKWLSDSNADRSSALKQLSKSAKQKYDEVKGVYVAPVSPQLRAAQSNYVKSLKLFEEGFTELAASVNEGSAQAALDKVASNSYYKEALNFALAGQKDYYGSMLKWAESVHADISSGLDGQNVISIDEWKELPLVVKFKVSSDYLSGQAMLTEYLPHDLTAKVDQFISSGQADKRKIKSFNAVAELLISTEAVTGGYFNEVKSRFYENEQLPQLPFFSTGK